MDCKKFVEEQIADIRQTMGDEKAINALSGGVDSSLVTILGHRAIGEKLKTVFVDSALMREGEPQRVVNLFASMGIPVEMVDAREEFLSALAGLTDPEEKREAITQTFYQSVALHIKQWHCLDTCLVSVGITRHTHLHDQKTWPNL